MTLIAAEFEGVRAPGTRKGPRRQVMAAAVRGTRRGRISAGGRRCDVRIERGWPHEPPEARADLDRVLAAWASRVARRRDLRAAGTRRVRRFVGGSVRVVHENLLLPTAPWSAGAIIHPPGPLAKRLSGGFFPAAAWQGHPAPAVMRTGCPPATRCRARRDGPSLPRAGRASERAAYAPRGRFRSSGWKVAALAQMSFSTHSGQRGRCAVQTRRPCLIRAMWKA